ncbi:cytochrome B [Endozoicomonas sp. OPT23]|uniref:cytochrome b n=1 Tax=Endozoicomonas sp. OPT23 TaxID=2072845 RepID=UPI00129B445B|nr:cytochrome b/b6 domain-containing protein [Endozoicomonas sp. OPT23]MRI31393.1 cytochrome B [Endozoicomonas sp. OPT23]
MATEKYSVSMRLMHWLMAICLLGMIGSGWYMTGLDGEAANKYDLYPWHKSFGVLLLGLIVLRIIIRLKSTLPEIQETIPGREQTLAKVAHFLLYLLMLLVPLSGFIMSDIGGHDIYFFGIPLPDLLDTHKPTAGTFHTIHSYIGYVLLGVVVVHIAGALKHRFMDSPENDVLKKMM